MLNHGNDTASVKYSGRRIWLGLVIVSLMSVLLPFIAEAMPSVSIHTSWWGNHYLNIDLHRIIRGDKVPVRLSVDNQGEGMSVDVYIGLLSLEGDLFVMGQDGWSDGIHPWMSNTYIPAGFSERNMMLGTLDTPCEMPPIEQEGTYYLLAGLTEPGALEFSNGVSVSGFIVLNEQARPLNVDLVAAEVMAMALRARRWYQTPEDEGGGGGAFSGLRVDDIGSAVNENGDVFIVSGQRSDSVWITGCCCVARMADGVTPAMVVGYITMEEIAISIHEWSTDPGISRPLR